MEKLITALEMRGEAIVEELEALKALSLQLNDPYRARIRELLLRISRNVP